MKTKFFLLILIFFVFLISQASQFFSSKTKLIFCNIGEGDGIILMHNKTVFLIDAGRDSRMRKCLERHLPFWQTEITGFISTHPDADHLFGIKSVIKRYSLKYLFSNFSPNKVGEYHQIYDALRNSGVIFKSFVVGEKIIVSNVGEGLRPSPWDRSSDLSLRNNKIAIESFWPNEEHKESEKTNLFSNISVITIGESKFLMLADSEIQTQIELLPQILKMQNANLKMENDPPSLKASEGQSNSKLKINTNIRVNPLEIRVNPGVSNQKNINKNNDSKWLAVKVSHHGSNKNFSLTLMKTLLPQYAVISVGPNKYGHPGKKVLDGISSVGADLPVDPTKNTIQILRTDKLNDIVFECEEKCVIRK